MLFETEIAVSPNLSGTIVIDVMLSDRRAGKFVDVITDSRARLA